MQQITQKRKSVHGRFYNRHHSLGNMFNAAASLAIGSCWVHPTRQMFETDEGKDLLRKWGVTGDFIGVSSCILGYVDCQHPKAAKRKDTFVIRV
jgi:hypothetical protein